MSRTASPAWAGTRTCGRWCSIDDATDEVLGTCLWDPWDRPRQDGGHGRVHGRRRGRRPRTPTGTCRRSITMLVTMFPKPAPGARTHISVGDAEVLFHEFGHVLDFTIGIAPLRSPLDDAWWGTRLGGGTVVLDGLLGPSARPSSRPTPDTPRPASRFPRRSWSRSRSSRRSRTCRTSRAISSSPGSTSRCTAGSPWTSTGSGAGRRRTARFPIRWARFRPFVLSMIGRWL